MKRIILFITMTICLFGYGQDCKYERNEVDEFTKNKILETESVWLTQRLSCSLKKVNDGKALKLIIHSGSVFSIRQGSKIMFLTEKEQPITLLFPESTMSKIRDLYNFYSINYIILLKEDYDRLKTETINKVRIYFSDGYLDYDVKEKKSKKFKEILNCAE